MGLLLILLLLFLLFGGLGFAVHALWWVLILIAIVAVISWVTGWGRAGPY